uniref:Uncharacterized protein n=1 Tax=Caenorhabditis japonica TaxID=281687 RepID=A0A8R1EEW0_CAEJA
MHGALPGKRGCLFLFALRISVSTENSMNLICREKSVEGLPMESEGEGGSPTALLPPVSYTFCCARRAERAEPRREEPSQARVEKMGRKRWEEKNEEEEAGAWFLMCKISSSPPPPPL